MGTQARNTLAIAEAEAKAEEMKLNPYTTMPPQALVGLQLHVARRPTNHQ